MIEIKIQVIRKTYLKHEKMFNFILVLLCLFYVNLMLPVMVRRYNYPQSFIEYML